MCDRCDAMTGATTTPQPAEAIDGLSMSWLNHFERSFSGGRREGPVELPQIVVAQVYFKSAAIFTDVIAVARFRNCDGVRLLKHLRDCNLRRRRIVSDRDPLDDGVLRQPGLLDRRVRHDRNLPLAAPGQ